MSTKIPPNQDQQKQIDLLCDLLAIRRPISAEMQVALFAFVCSQPYTDRNDIAKLIRVFKTVFNITHAQCRGEIRQAIVNAPQVQRDELLLYVSNSAAMHNYLLTDIDFASEQISNKKSD